MYIASTHRYLSGVAGNSPERRMPNVLNAVWFSFWFIF